MPSGPLKTVFFSLYGTIIGDFRGVNSKFHKPRKGRQQVGFLDASVFCDFLKFFPLKIVFSVFFNLKLQILTSKTPPLCTQDGLKSLKY